MSCIVASNRVGGHSVESVTATSFYSTHLAALLFARGKASRQCRDSAGGDRDSVNSARSTRTRFYSARKTRSGIATAVSGGLRRDEFTRRVAPLLRRRMGNTIPPRESRATATL